MNAPTLVSESRCFGGWQRRYKHTSEVLACDMHFSVYVPPHVEQQLPLPALYWLSGLTCSDENFVIKAGAQRVAAELGLVLVMPDTSPRGESVPDADSYDLGQGAGFYVNATASPWNTHYRMYDYVVEELPDVVHSLYRLQQTAAIAGHSMGGHGALVIGLSNQKRFSSISAFAPIVNPTSCPWGQKAFSAYLGEKHGTWRDYDACELMAGQGGFITRPMLVDQGLADEFIDTQKLTRPLEEVAKSVNYPAEFRYHEGYDHSYFFIASMIEEHLRFHAKHLKQY